jgi:SAM-dependent methyltransferase
MNPEQKQATHAHVGQDKIWTHFQNEGADSFVGSAPRLDFLMRRVQRLAHGTPRVLNVGIGSGYFEKRCVDAGFQTASLDPDAGAIARVRALGVDAHSGSLVKLPFADGIFDFVVASEVLEHLAEPDLQKALKEIYRVLDHGGNFLGTVPFNELLKDNECVCPKCGTLFHRWGHEQTFTAGKLRQLLSADFDVNALKVRAFVAFSGRSWMGKIKSLFKSMLGALGEQVADPHLYFHAQKRDGYSKTRP